MIQIKSSIPKTNAPEPGPTEVEKKILDAAKMYEKQFLREMVKAMRTTVPGDGLIQKGQAEKIFQEQLDEQYVEEWGDKGGLGLHQLIYDQLLERYGEQLGIRPRVYPPKGPIPLEQSSSVKLLPQASVHKEQTYSVNRSSEFSEPLEISAPWQSMLLGQYPLNDSQQIIELGHDNGLRSRLIVDNTFQLEAGKSHWGAGERLGLLGVNTNSYTWSVGALPQSGDIGRGPDIVSE